MELTPQQRQLLEERARHQERNPNLFFRPHPCSACGKRYANAECRDHRIGQHQFLASHVPITAAFAGNQFGKTTVLVNKAFIQHIPDEVLPKHLKPYRFIKHDEPVVGWLVCPSARAATNYLIPALRQWAPRDFLFGGSFDKAWRQQDGFLRFKDGGRLHVFTYEMDPDKFVGAQVDYVGFDEPPTEPIFNECSVRVIRRSGKLFFTLTPVNSGGGIGWLYDRIYEQREHPDITVVRGSIHDNPHLPQEAVDQFIEQHRHDPDFAARERGDFVHIGGMVYPGAFEHSVLPRLNKKQLEGRDIVVGLDPGLKNAAFVWVAFDNDNRAVAFDEVLLQEKTPGDYAKAIRAKNAEWGIRPRYVIDPSARNRSLTNAESVEALLQREGLFPMHGFNDVQAGVQQIRNRLAEKAFFVTDNCRGLRKEADRYRMQDRADGEFAVVKENDHRLDALRYAVTTRLWNPVRHRVEAKQELGYRPGVAPPLQNFLAQKKESPTHPLGSMA